MSSATVFAGTDGCATSTMGSSISPDTGAMSRCRLNGRFSDTMRVDDGGRAEEQQRVAVGRRIGHRLDGKAAAGARPVLDDDLLAEPLRQPRRHDPA